MNSKVILKWNKYLWIVAILLVAGVKLFASNTRMVEALYSAKFYFFFSQILRFLFGWIPFSLGDILYLLAGCWLLWKLIKNGILLFKKQIRWPLFFEKILKIALGLIFIYLVFNIIWGLNYNREGIESQLGLSKEKYDSLDVINIQNLLLQKVNASKEKLMQENFADPDRKEIFNRAEKCYEQVEKVYPFLQYKNPSLKSSLYGWWGNYLGFTGYYNPFTGEAQVNTTVPKFLQPYIAAHEMAHQIGYAKENAASFVGYLASSNSDDTLFHYSAYLDLYIYANREVYYFDSSSAKQSAALLIPEVKKDLEEWRKFNNSHKSFLEPAITWMYGNYLKLNEQPRGMHSYNEVISMLIAYYKKFGKI
jgi:hypothetical protein